MRKLSRLIGVLSTLCFILIVSADPLAKPVIVTVTKNDGTKLRAQLTAADPKSIDVTELIKNLPTGDKTTIPWSDVKTVSNGLTQKRLIEMWKKDHPADICKTCQGEGKVFCPTCHGTGRLASTAAECPTCHGAMTIPCTTPKCDKGMIPCPKNHIKLTEGTWYTKADGKRWRKFPSPQGMWEISEGHLGQVFDAETGKYEPHECKLCGGKMIIPDPKCKGTGLLPCNTCTTAALKGEKCPDCDKGKIPDKACNGTGLATLGPPPVDPATTQPAPQ